ncbi:MAG: hypothetical protein ACR2J8_07650 [Thermomicrobiales bacterium]
MDHQAFDRIATLLGSAASRRAGIRAALGAAFGTVPAVAAAQPHQQGPCGDKSRAANRCTKNGDCCTEICVTDLSNKDKVGRCRCRISGKSCEKDLNCCKRKGVQMACNGGVCGDRCSKLGKSCSSTIPCCAGACTGVAAGNDRGDSSGQTCCLETGASGCTKKRDCCGASTGDADCVAGVCTSTCLPMRATCTLNDQCCTNTCGLLQAPVLDRGGAPYGCCIALLGYGCTVASDCCYDAGVVSCGPGGQCVRDV